MVLCATDRLRGPLTIAARGYDLLSRRFEWTSAPFVSQAVDGSRTPLHDQAS